MMSEQERNAIQEALPHGSGIDSAWHFKYRGTNIVFTNSIHCMDENGYYDGWQDFSVIIFTHTKDVTHDLKGPLLGKRQVLWRKGDRDFKIEFNGPRRQKYIESWRDPLYQWIGDALSKFNIGRMRTETVLVNEK